MRFLLSAALIAVLGVGCAVPGDTRDAAIDEAAIRVLIEQFAAGFIANDPELVARCVTTDFVAMAPGEIAVEGRDAVQAKIAQDLGVMEVRELAFEVLDLHVTGDWAWARAVSRAEVVLRESGEVGRLRGKTLWIFHRGVDGAWRIARDASSADDS